jgi:predicted nucleic acid-binding Zn ribbon protein
MAKCGACGKELAADVQRFCNEECRDVFMKSLKRGTRSAPGRTTAKRRRKRGR